MKVQNLTAFDIYRGTKDYVSSTKFVADFKIVRRAFHSESMAGPSYHFMDRVNPR